MWLTTFTINQLHYFTRQYDIFIFKISKQFFLKYPHCFVCFVLDKEWNYLHLHLNTYIVSFMRNLRNVIKRQRIGRSTCCNASYEWKDWQHSLFLIRSSLINLKPWFSLFRKKYFLTSYLMTLFPLHFPYASQTLDIFKSFSSESK